MGRRRGPGLGLPCGADGSRRLRAGRSLRSFCRYRRRDHPRSVNSVGPRVPTGGRGVRTPARPPEPRPVDRLPNGASGSMRPRSRRLMEKRGGRCGEINPIGGCDVTCHRGAGRRCRGGAGLRPNRRPAVSSRSRGARRKNRFGARRSSRRAAGRGRRGRSPVAIQRRDHQGVWGGRFFATRRGPPGVGVDSGNGFVRPPPGWPSAATSIFPSSAIPS